MWNDLVGTWGYKADASGTVTIPAGAKVIQIICHGTSGPTVKIFGGDTLNLPNNDVVSLRFNHALVQAGNNSKVSGSQDVVFANTSFYFVEYVKSGNT